MDVAPLLLELYGRIPPLARQAVDGLDLARVQDHHVAEILDTSGGYGSHRGSHPTSRADSRGFLVVVEMPAKRGALRTGPAQTTPLTFVCSERVIKGAITSRSRGNPCSSR